MNQEHEQRMKNLGNALKSIRKKKKISLQKLQDEMGISRQTLQHYESGKGRSLAVYMQAFNVLGYELGVLPHSKDENVMRTLVEWIETENKNFDNEHDLIQKKLSILGNLVKRIRKSQKKSMSQMEHTLAMSSHIYQSLEDGKPTASLISYIHTFEALGVSCSIAYWITN